MTVLVDIVSTLATIALVVLLLGPAPSIYQVYKTHTTGVTPITPLVSLFTNSWIWTIYGYLDHNIFPVAVCNFTGVVLSFIYTVIFYRWTANRAFAHKVIGGFGLVVVIATVYAFVGGFGYTNQSRESVKNVFGYVGVVTVLVFFASPLENVALVMKHRSAVFIPILVVIPGAVNSAMWVIYSLLTSDWFIFVPNAGAFVLASIQIGLYVVFHPSTHPYVEVNEDIGSSHKDLEASGAVQASASKEHPTSPSYVSLQSPAPLHS